jgi:hypothetical protein
VYYGRTSEANENLMQRCTFLCALGAAALAGSHPAATQQPAESFRCLLRMPARSYSVEGRNLVIEYDDGAGKPERLDELAAELPALKVDVIWSGGGTRSDSPTKAIDWETFNDDRVANWQTSLRHKQWQVKEAEEREGGNPDRPC